MLLMAGSAAVAFVLALVLTPLCRNLADRIGLVDRPDHRRKLHRHPVPRVGGVAILLAMGGGVATLFLSREHMVTLRWSGVGPFMAALAVVFFTGLLDDLIGLKPWEKLIGQTAAAALACGAGVRISSLAGHNIGHLWWHVPLTLVWLVGCTNAFNLIDGVDGLAAGIGLFAALTTLVAALLNSNFTLAFAIAPLAGALLGFLRYNFNPASIFLGDCGSLSIGFLLGCYGVIWTQKSATVLGMTAPLIALCIPILEAGLSILRRLLRGQPIFVADRRHIHHRLLDLGFSTRKVALLMYAAAGVAAGCSLLISVSGDQVAGVIVLLFCAGAWIGVQHLGYGEFQAARTVVFGGLIQRVINAQVTLKQLRSGLAGADSLDEQWNILSDTSRKLGFHEAGLTVDGRVWTSSPGPAPECKCWRMTVPVNGSGVAHFSIPIDGNLYPATLAAFAAIVANDLAPETSKTKAATGTDGPLQPATAMRAAAGGSRR